MIKKKMLSVTLALAALLVILDAALCLVMNCYVIPRFVRPQLEQLLRSDAGRPFNLSVGRISFHPWRAFVLNDIVFSAANGAPGRYILRARQADVNVAFTPLLFKRLQIRHLKIIRPDLNISRDESGNWNIGFLFAQGVPAQPGSGDGFRLEVLDLRNGRLEYSDHFNKDNTLERRFVALNLLVKNADHGIYVVKFSMQSQESEFESLALKLYYDANKKRAEGEFRVDVVYLEDYWNYYLDDIFKPWHFEAQGVSSQARFVYQDDTFELNGDYDVADGVLTYGVFTMGASATVKQNLKFVHGKLVPEGLRSDIDLRDGYFTGMDENVLVDRINCLASVTKDEIDIMRLSGMSGRFPLTLSGKFRKYPKKRLYLNGNFADVATSFDLEFLPDNRGTLEWRNTKDDSYLNLNANITDLQDLLFNLTIRGNIILADLLKLHNAPVGNIEISGAISGAADQPSSYQGNVNVLFKGLNWIGFAPGTFTINALVKDGVLNGNIPPLAYYNGTLFGKVRMDTRRWGIALQVKDASLEEFLKAIPSARNRDIKGQFSGKLVCLMGWGNPDSLKGGGYFHVTSGSLRGLPVFSAAETGIGSIIKGFIMPVFYTMDGNFSLFKDGIGIDNTLCCGPTTDLFISGTYLFNGKTDFTVGVTIAGAGILKVAKQLMFFVMPFTIVVDFVTNSIQVNVSGQWPDLKQKTIIQPMAWFNNFLSFTRQSGPSKYTLSGLWEEATKATTDKNPAASCKGKK